MQLNSFEECDAYVGAAEPLPAAISGSVAAMDICGLWQRARPVAKFLVRFAPSRYRPVLDPLMNVLDAVCPVVP